MKGGVNPPPPRVGGESEILLGVDYFPWWKEPEEEWFWQFEAFSKLKTADCEYSYRGKVIIKDICNITGIGYSINTIKGKYVRFTGCNSF